MGFRFSGFRVYGLGFRIWGLWFRFGGVGFGDVGLIYYILLDNQNWMVPGFGRITRRDLWCRHNMGLNNYFFGLLGVVILDKGF